MRKILMMVTLMASLGACSSTRVEPKHQPAPVVQSTSTLEDDDVADKTCGKGCPCGDTCISCQDVCHKPYGS